MNKKNFKRPHYIRIHIQKIKDSPKEIIGMRGGWGHEKEPFGIVRHISAGKSRV